MHNCCKSSDQLVQEVNVYLLIPEFFYDFKYKNIEVLKYLNKYEHYSYNYLIQHILYNKLYSNSLISVIYDAFLTDNQKYSKHIKELMIAALLYTSVYRDTDFKKSFKSSLDLLKLLKSEQTTKNAVAYSAFYRSFNYQWLHDCVDVNIIEGILKNVYPFNSSVEDQNIADYVYLFRDILILGYFCFPFNNHKQNIDTWCRRLCLFNYDKNRMIDELNRIVNMYRPYSEYGYNLLSEYFNNDMLTKDTEYINTMYEIIEAELATETKTDSLIDTGSL